MGCRSFLDQDEILIRLIEQEKVEKVSPKIELFRNPSIGGSCDPKIRIKGARGGRGAGAKSHSMTSLIVQRANYETLRICCFREIQQSLDESVYALIEQKVEFLGYDGWLFLDNRIISPTGSLFIFKGLKDLRASKNVKGLESFDIFFIEEAATIAMESWNLIMPTLMRHDGSELWFCYNPEQEVDPVTQKIWNRDRDDALCIELKPGKEDNPWWNSGLKKEMEEDFALDPDEAEHIWYGLPRKQGFNSVLSRAKIRQSMNRIIENPVGQKSVGCDVARFGDDETVIFVRLGSKIIEWKVIKGQDTQLIAKELWSIVKMDPSIPIKVDDTGVGGGVTDRLTEFGAKVIPINFGSNAFDVNKFGDCASEMWFNLNLDEIDIPSDERLMRELSGRLYSYDNKNRRKIEPKSEFKKRIGKSPDFADALILCYYEDKNIFFDKKESNALAARRSKRF